MKILQADYDKLSQDKKDASNYEVVPNPGSKEARAMNDICPVMDNSYGKGYFGSGEYIINMECPIHKDVTFNQDEK